MTPDYDIAIIGAGLVGLSFALNLPESVQARTLLVDAAAEPGSDWPGPPGLDDRGTALNRRSLSIFRKLGVLDRITPAMGEIRHIEVSQAGYWGLSELTDDHALGAVVSNRHLGAALWERVQQSRLQWRFNTVGTTVTMHSDRATIALEGSGDVSCRLLVLADGNRSGLARRLGFGERRHDYGQHAITFNIERSGAANGRAYERFTREGPRALLPLAENRQTVVWTADQEMVEDILATPVEDWKTAVLSTFGTDQGAVTAVSDRSAYPLSMTRTCEIGRPRIVQLGNSAMTLHPVAGQGFNLHLRTAEQLARAVSDAAGDPGSRQALTPWLTSTEAAFDQMQQACHGLVRLFEPQWSPLAHLRGLGLASLNAFAPARRSIISLALGYSHPPLNKSGVRSL